MTKTLCVLSLMLCCAVSAIAVPAKAGWHTITQSDGSTLTVQTVGNAFNSAILTTDGLMVERGRDGDFYYISSLTGMTAVRAHEPAHRNASEKAFVSAQRRSLTLQPKSYKMPTSKGGLRATGSNAQADVPAQGDRVVPIILVEFQDRKFVNTREKIIESMLTGEVSVGQYFHDQSNGRYQPKFDVHGIYTLSQNREYYGGHEGTTKDKGIGWMVTEACQMAAADGVSFKPYDTNDDYYCDVVIIIFAGVGEAQASLSCPDAIWPCNWTLEAARSTREVAMAPSALARVSPMSTTLLCSTSFTAAARPARPSTASALLSTSLGIVWACPTCMPPTIKTTTAWAIGTSCARDAMPMMAIHPWAIRPMRRCL